MEVRMDRNLLMSWTVSLWNGSQWKRVSEHLFKVNAEKIVNLLKDNVPLAEIEKTVLAMIESKNEWVYKAF